MLRAVRSGFRPNRVVALKSGADQEAEKIVALLAGKTQSGKVTTYLCENFACKAPLIGVEAAEKDL